MALPLLKNVPVPFFISRSHLFYRLNHVSPLGETIRLRLTTQRDRGGWNRCQTVTSLRENKQEGEKLGLCYHAGGGIRWITKQPNCCSVRSGSPTLYADFLTVVISRLCIRLLISDSVKRRVHLSHQDNSDEIVTLSKTEFNERRVQASGLDRNTDIWLPAEQWDPPESVLQYTNQLQRAVCDLWRVHNTGQVTLLDRHVSLLFI